MIAPASWELEDVNPKWVMWVCISLGFTLLAYIPYNPFEHPVYYLLVSAYIFFAISYTIQYMVEGSIARVYLSYADDYEEGDEEEDVAEDWPQ